MRDTKDDTDHYDSVLLEDMNHKFDVILEYLAPLASLSGDVARLKTDMIDVKGDIKIMKAVLKDSSKDITELKADTKTIKLTIKDQNKDHNDLVKQVTKRWNKH